jgi:CTP:molybdopterin cytidylyltransferase MocA
VSVAAVVLAAGESRRLGEAKQLVELTGERLLERAVRVATEARCEPVVVVLGARAEEIRAATRLGGAKVVVNEGWREGMASSIRVGVNAVGADALGIVVMTCDQPAVDAAHLERLMRAGAAEAVRVSSSYAGRRGVPAYFPVEDVAVLTALVGDAGARALLEASKTVRLKGGELDVDTREALEAARARFSVG